MAKAKQGNASGSAAQRREQVRQQRQQESQKAQTQARNRNTRKRAQSRSPWLLVGGILVLVAVIVGVFIYLSNQPASGPSSSGTAFKTITTIKPSVLASVGTGSANNLMKPVTGASPLTGPTGKPEFFYVGGEYCPFCAAQRWAMIVALSRFGTFSNVSQITSSEDSISTFSFHNSTYKSQYIDFVPVETSDNQNPPQALEQLTSAQQQLLNTYDAPPYTDAQSAGSIPFIDIANRLVSSGSYYSPNVLIGHSWDDIANQIQDPSTDISKGVLGAANYLTASICLATQNQPASVCSANPIPQIEGSLPKASSSDNQMGLAVSPLVMAVRQRE
jgi:disulfide bond formation protein DsbB